MLKGDETVKMKQNRPGWKCENMEQRIRKEEVEKRWNIEITGHLNEKTGGGVNMRESCKSVISFRRQGKARQGRANCKSHRNRRLPSAPAEKDCIRDGHTSIFGIAWATPVSKDFSMALR